MSSCAKDYYLGEDEMATAMMFTDDGNIQECIFTDSVYITDGYEYIEITDSLNQEGSCTDLSLAYPINQQKLSDVIIHEGSYFVRKKTFIVYFALKGIKIPIIFTREIVSNNVPNTQKNAHVNQFRVSSIYNGTDPLVTGEERYSKSYFDMYIQVYGDSGKLSGYLRIKLSLYTKNACITFGADVQDTTNVTITN